MNQSFKKITLFAVLLMSFAPFAFTNCAQNPQSAQVPPTAFMGEEEKLNYLQNQFQGKVSALFCENQQSYACMKRVYSRTVASEQMPSTNICLSESFCVPAQVIHFNSQEAQEECDNCEDNYETENFVCHLKLANSEGVYPITKFAENAQDAVAALKQVCHGMVK